MQRRSWGAGAAHREPSAQPGCRVDRNTDSAYSEASIDLEGESVKELVPDVHLIEGLRAAHAYLLVSYKGHLLLDTGTPGEADRIEREIQEGGFSLSDVKTIVLTHAHNDHVGSAAELARRCGAQVLAHEEEVPYIEQTAPLPFNTLP
jgi:glyoxylase-like metal-dependent hydrolase (beta-lactamase superfamily II)